MPGTSGLSRNGLLSFSRVGSGNGGGGGDKPDPPNTDVACDVRLNKLSATELISVIRLCCALSSEESYSNCSDRGDSTASLMGQVCPEARSESLGIPKPRVAGKGRSESRPAIMYVSDEGSSGVSDFKVASLSAMMDTGCWRNPLIMLYSSSSALLVLLDAAIELDRRDWRTAFERREEVDRLRVWRTESSGPDMNVVVVPN